MPSPAFVTAFAPRAPCTQGARICQLPSARRPAGTTPRRARVVCTSQPPVTPPATPADKPSPPPASESKKRVGLVTVLLVLAAVIWALIISAIMFVTRLFRFRSDGKQRWEASLALLWMRDVLRSAFVKVSVHGREHLPSGAALVVANSQSPLDMFALAFLRIDLRFMLPARVYRVPVLGWMLARAGWIGLDGVDRKSQMKALEACGEKLAEGSSVVMFPEGAMSETGVMKRFPSPAFKAARKGGVPVVPVTVHGSASMCEGGVPYRYPKGGIEVTVHPPISLEAGSDKEIANMAYEAVRSGLPEHLRQG